VNAAAISTRVRIQQREEVQSVSNKEQLPTGLVIAPADAIELLTIWQTWLGSERRTCDQYHQPIWDRIDAVVAASRPLDEHCLEALREGAREDEQIDVASA